MTRRYVAAAALLAAFATANHAAIAPLGKDQLRAKASHVVTGKVTAVYTREETSRDWRNVEGVVEVAVTAVEKGDRLAPGDSVYARFWTTEWIGTGTPTTTFGAGHEVPTKDATVRAHLTRKAGGYDALLPNGFEPLPEPAASEPRP